MKNVAIADTFHINPQLHLILSEMEEVIVSLNQHSIMEPKVKQIKQQQFLITYCSRLIMYMVNTIKSYFMTVKCLF
jgi:hypothetical protein